MYNLQDLFLNELADCHDAECRFGKALPGMMKAVTNDELKMAFRLLLKETEGRVIKLGKVFECFDRKARWKTCEPVMSMLRDGACLAVSFEHSPAINAALVVSAQRVGHYKMATYGCLQEWALQLGSKKAALLLKELLEEEKASHKSLTVLARTLCHDEKPAVVVVVAAVRVKERRPCRNLVPSFRESRA